MCQSVQRKSSESGFVRCAEKAICDQAGDCVQVGDHGAEESKVVAVVVDEILEVLCRGRRSPRVGLALAQIYVCARE